MSLLKDYPFIQVIQDIARHRKVAVYLVGGFLRDYLLGADHAGSGSLNPMCFKDFDFAVEKEALSFARLFARKIRGAYVLLDKERGCARVVHQCLGQTSICDFADFRAHPFAKDLAHRDFTINTLSIDVHKLERSTAITDALADYKDGIKDLRAKRIRRVSVKAFREDPLRLLRAFGLCAVLGFKVERVTLTQIHREKDLLRDASYERIRDELFKILTTNRAAATLKAMDKVGLLEKIIPQVKVMYACAQGPYHHLNVWRHTLEAVVQFEDVITQTNGQAQVVDYLNESLGGNRPRRALLKLALLLHDIGKPQTRRQEKGRMTFYGHERVGKNITTHIARMLKLSVRERHALEDMVLWHLRPGYLSNFRKPSEKAIYRYFRDTKQEAVGISLLSLADQRATRGPLTTAHDQRHHERICLNLVQRYFDKKKERPFVRLINGHEVMRRWRLSPSPLIGKILREVAEGQALGKIHTKEEALVLAGRIVHKGKLP